MTQTELVTPLSLVLFVSPAKAAKRSLLFASKEDAQIKVVGKAGTLEPILRSDVRLIPNMSEKHCKVFLQMSDCVTVSGVLDAATALINKTVKRFDISSPFAIIAKHVDTSDFLHAADNEAAAPSR